MVEPYKNGVVDVGRGLWRPLVQTFCSSRVTYTQNLLCFSIASGRVPGHLWKGPGSVFFAPPLQLFAYNINSTSGVVQQSWAQGKDHLPRPAGNTLLNASQNTISLFLPQAHIAAYPPAEHQELQYPFLESCFPDHLLVYWCLGSFFPSCRTLYSPLLSCIRFQSAHSFLRPIDDLLDGSTTLWCVRGSHQFWVIRKFSEGTLWPIILVINEVAEQDWTQYWPLEHTNGLQLDFMPLMTMGSEYLLSHFSIYFTGLLLQPMLHQLFCDNLMGGSAKSFPEVKVDNIHCSGLIYKVSHSTQWAREHWIW